MRFLLGLGLGFLAPLILQAWLRNPGPKAVHTMQKGDEKRSRNGAVHEVSSPPSTDRADTMDLRDRSLEFAWPKVQGDSHDSEFHW
jgi:hypothetical protein